VLADNASWLFRSAPYLIFAAAWVGNGAGADLRQRPDVQLGGGPHRAGRLARRGRAFMALAGMDIGTSFGGIGASREMMIASAGRARHADGGADHWRCWPEPPNCFRRSPTSSSRPPLGLRVSLALALLALVIVAIAENARIPVDNPATHLELTMVHEAMVLEYSGRHLALIDWAAIAASWCCTFAAGLPLRPWAWRRRGGADRLSVGGRAGGLSGEDRRWAPSARRLFESQHRQDARVPRRSIPRRGADARAARRGAAVRVAELA
jgi:hypothetical protein